MTKEIRVRFAPSPTGALHLGGARTAIYNWLFARRNGGKFLLRIEDTDVERSRHELVEQIYESLRWLGVNWDEEPIFQSQRLDIYKKKVAELLEKGAAYRCFCTLEDLDNERQVAQANHRAYKYSGKCRNLTTEQIAENLAKGCPFAVRFKIEPGITSWNDIVFGQITVNNAELDDFIIQRSTGVPVYQMAVVVDDIAMGITHIIRGEDHIPNTPKQINIFRAFGQPIPEFAHLPLLLGIDGKRLSKRHGATGVDEYRDMGFPAEAVFNYLALLGWAPKNGQDVLKVSEIIPQFELSAISRKAAVFDPKKLEWVSSQHISRMEIAEIRELLIPRLIDAKIIESEVSPQLCEYIDKVIILLKERVKTFQHFIDWGAYFFQDPVNYEEKAVAKYWQDGAIVAKMTALQSEYTKLPTFDAVVLEECLRRVAETLNVKAADLIHPLRLALTGFSISPGIFQVAELLGKETVLRRISLALKKLTKTG